MPYIKRNERIPPADDGYVLRGGQDWSFKPDNAGDLNYTLTMVIASYVRYRGLSYQTINDAVGALEGAKAEFQRRVVAPYEDTKIATNGDVYDQSLLSRTDVRDPKV